MSQVRYEILGPLIPGEGSRPSLALALEDGAPPRPVVLVWAPADVVQDAAMLSRLRRETERAVVFEHPNILRVHGLVTLDGRVARVTEFADGESLRQVLEAGQRLPLPFAALIAADVAKGVHYAHVAGNDDGTPLIHGDIRPETVMVSFNGVCKLSGYGALGVAPRERNGRRVRNRRLYSAPEQLMGGREASSVLTDVFLLGLLLYECLSGRKPFQDSIDQDKAILNRPLPPLPAEVPLRFNEVVRRATAKRSGDRYPSALAFRDALVEVAGDLSSSAAFAEYLTKVIPANGEARVARKKMIEEGIAAVASRAAAPITASTPIIRGAAPAYTPPPISGSAPTITAPMPVIAPAAPPAPSTPSPAGPEAPVAAIPPVAPPGAAPARPHRSAVPLVVGVGALLLVSAVGTVWSTRKKADLSIPEDTGNATVSFEPPVLLEAEPPDAGMIQKATPTPGVARTMVSLSVSPSVAVAIDGRAAGVSPLTVPLTPGRHLLTFTDESKGLKTARLIDVRATTDTVSFTIRLGMGSVLLHAPSGARVSLDGQDLGTAPIAERTLFEGEHTLRVTQKDAVWEKAFVLQGDQRLVFDADLESE
ncbi:serine/threonine protein kinase [Archangium violaceum]|uniref:serine/threonine-protein kinase n=1 Tax=Archangium violaceum TaxID=83451 RepID=UPI00193C4BAD|nr:serine/threonine-protein kinase [Archangium violaceum]QRK06364.1 serine/threonine protein kinase [Archangium violaceum]